MTEKKKKPGRADIFSRGQEKLRMLEELGDVSGRTQEQAEQEQAIDAIFNDTEVKDETSPTYNWWENIFRGD